MLGQGIPFFHAGQDLLRSKSLDRNSYDSGDWFNRLDFTYNSNNWGVGLPPAENLSNWMIMRPLLANPALKPTRANILAAAMHFQEMLKIRKSSRLFRLRTAAEVNTKLKFLNTGPDQIPGLIILSIDDTVGTDLDKNYDYIVVFFNATRGAQSFTIAQLKGSCVRLHPVQAESADSVVRTAEFNHLTGTFNIPPRTTAVFVR
jgi:pullulanase/glycogen debranching enzyme